MEHLTLADESSSRGLGNTEWLPLYAHKEWQRGPGPRSSSQWRSILSWSLNSEEVSKEFEIGAPSFERRLQAARKVQEAGYRIRIRLDPIVPIPEWKTAYANTIHKIFENVNPESVTIGTSGLRKASTRWGIRSSNPRSWPDLLRTWCPCSHPSYFPEPKDQSQVSTAFLRKKG